MRYGRAHYVGYQELTILMVFYSIALSMIFSGYLAVKSQQPGD